MKLASAASPTELINGAENLTKNTNEDGVVYIFLKCVVYIYIFILPVSSFKNNSVLLVFLVLATTNSFLNC